MDDQPTDTGLMAAVTAIDQQFREFVAQEIIKAFLHACMIGQLQSETDIHRAWELQDVRVDNTAKVAAAYNWYRST